MKKLFFLSLLISLISPIQTFAGFPDGEKGFDLKKIIERHLFKYHSYLFAFSLDGSERCEIVNKNSCNYNLYQRKTYN
tara:strand:+ start:162 stop:395 length:234 start_codon:yes stop_codon:yes gene_type:complete